MSNLTVPTFSIRDFTLTDSSVLISEASSLRFSHVGRMYDDACDEGIAVESPSGRTERFVLAERHVDSEGDLMYWHFTPESDKLATVKALRIYND